MARPGRRWGDGATSGVSAGLAGASIASAALVCAAAYLGADWLRWPIAGLPIGAWLMLGVVGVTWARGRKPARAGCRVRSDGSGWALRNRLGRIIALDWGTIRGRLVDFCARVMGMWTAWARSIEQRAQAVVDRLPVRDRPVRIRMDLPRAAVRAILEAPGSVASRWESGRNGSRIWPRRPDATVSLDGRGRLVVRVPQCSGRGAAWSDWSVPRPLTYSNVFPMRIDAAELVVVAPRWDEAGSGALVRAVVEAMAVLGASRVRVGLVDRLLGRTPLAAESEHAGWPGGEPTVADAAMEGLSRQLLRRVGRRAGLNGGGGGDAEPMLRAAARAVTAWLSRWDGRDDADWRREVADACLELIRDEAEAWLRVAAIRVADDDDDGAIEALWRAEQLMDRQRPPAVIDHLAFLQSEIEHGAPGRLRLGRLVAGICLIHAAVEPALAEFVRDDIMDDLQHSGWLIGRERDRELVWRVLDRLSRPAALASAA